MGITRSLAPSWPAEYNNFERMVKYKLIALKSFILHLSIQTVSAKYSQPNIILNKMHVVTTDRVRTERELPLLRSAGR